MQEKLVYVRAVLNLSQQELAQKLGVSFATVNRWEKGRAIPSKRHEICFEMFCKANKVVFDEQGG